MRPPDRLPDEYHSAIRACSLRLPLYVRVTIEFSRWMQFDGVMQFVHPRIPVLRSRICASGTVVEERKALFLTVRSHCWFDPRHPLASSDCSIFDHDHPLTPQALAPSGKCSRLVVSGSAESRGRDSRTEDIQYTLKSIIGSMDHPLVAIAKLIGREPNPHSPLGVCFFGDIVICFPIT